MMPNSFPEQARETDSLDASSDDPLPMGLFKFLKNTYFSVFLRKTELPQSLSRRGTGIQPFNRKISNTIGREEIQKFSGHFIFQKYIKGVTGLSGIA